MGLLLGVRGNNVGMSGQNRQAAADLAKADAASNIPLPQRIEQQATQYRSIVEERNRAANNSGNGESTQQPVTMQDTIRALTGLKIEDPNNLDYDDLAAQMQGNGHGYNQTYTQAFEDAQIEKQSEADKAAARAAEVATQRMRESTIARQTTANQAAAEPVYEGGTADVQLSLGEGEEDEVDAEGNSLGRRRRSRDSFRGTAGIKI